MTRSTQLEDRPAPTTLGHLLADGYQPVPVKEELRRNAIRRLAEGQRLIDGVIGYDDTVLPQLANALLGGQDIILLGERGQAKSRIVRSLVELLDEWYPVLEGSEIPENPLRPTTSMGHALIAQQGNDAPVQWLHRSERYAEKLATPDITIADLIGEVDPIKVAEGRYLTDEATLHYGLVPRVNHGVFAVNELPDLAERIQVGLLNLLEERDIQIRGHRVRLPLDVLIVATANPEDYTNRGRIITPLKDRYGAQIRTHYPTTIEDELAILDQEAEPIAGGDYGTHVAPFMREIIAQITHEARLSPDINQRSGVSVRATIACYQTLLANAFRRALAHGESEIAPRISDLPYVMPSLQGKIEFEAMEEGQEDKITARLVNKAVKKVFDRHYDIQNLESIAAAFSESVHVDTASTLPATAYEDVYEEIPAFRDLLADPAAMSPGERAATVEFVLEGLHLHQLLNKHSSGGHAVYSG